MATSSGELKTEIESWLKVVLKHENLQDFSLSLAGSTEKGDGYIGDIVFASVSGTNANGPQSYELVLKCSKRSEAFRKASPVKESFTNEIQIYEKILPYFTKFQKDKGVQDPFDSFPKFYGSVTEHNMEVIVLQNMKSLGYELWPKKLPLSRKHLDHIVTQYGKFHATSAALEIQEPEVFRQLVAPLKNLFILFAQTADVHVLFESPVDEVTQLLQDVVDEGVLQKWKGFKNQINDFLVDGIGKTVTGMNVILHGDCWNHNFMHLHKDGKIPSRVAFLDWQVSRYASPIFDLSYFIFSCISEEDLQQLDDILKTYHDSFLSHLGLLGIKKPEGVYPFAQFLNEWKSYSRFGIMMSTLLMKVVSTDKDEVLDMAQVAEDGVDVGLTFAHDIRDKENYRKRIKPLVEYVVKHELV